RRVAMPLPLTRRDHPAADDARPLSRRRAKEFVLGEARDREAEVDPIQQRARQSMPVPVLLIRPTPADLARIAGEAARTGVGGRDQREPGGERHRSAGAGHDDRPVLERLPERLDRIAPELRQLIEEQDTAMWECG